VSDRAQSRRPAVVAARAGGVERAPVQASLVRGGAFAADLRDERRARERALAVELREPAKGGASAALSDWILVRIRLNPA
jgi:hypothetical protein